MSAHGVFSICTTDDDLVVFASESVAFAPICCVIMTLPKPVFTDCLETNRRKEPNHQIYCVVRSKHKIGFHYAVQLEMANAKTKRIAVGSVMC